MEKRNYFVDVLKFIFAIIIVFYHTWKFKLFDYNTSYFRYGYLAVDFYFIVTGYLLINSINKKKLTYNKETIGKDACKFIWGKLKGIWIYLLLSYIVALIFININQPFTIETFFSDEILSNISGLNFLGYGVTVNVPTWYISTMIFILFIIYPLIVKNKKNYTYYIAPLSIVLTIIVKNYFQINMYDPTPVSFLFINGFYRGIIFINLGIIIYEISDHLKRIDLKKSQRTLLTILEIVLYLFLIYNMHYRLIYRYPVAILFILATIITFSNQSYTKDVFKSHIWAVFSKIGFLMYLNHEYLRSFIIKYFSMYSYREMVIIFFLCTIIISSLMYIVVEGSKCLIRKYKYKKLNS